MTHTKVTDREKEIIVRLAEANVSAAVIAKAFGIKTQAVAAYKAWSTMRSK